MDLQETLEEKRVEFKEVSTRVNGMLENSPRMFSSAYEQLVAEEKKYSKMAKALDVPFCSRVPKKEIEQSLNEVIANVGSISEKVEEMIGISFETPEEAINAADIMKGYGEKAKSARDAQNALFNMIHDYSDEASFDLKRGVDERVQEIVKKTRLQLIAIKRQDLLESKISFWGRMMGAERLRAIELETLALEESIVNNSPVIKRDSYNVQDSLADMRAFAMKELDKQNTNDMVALLKSATEVFDIQESVIEDKAEGKLLSLPMVMNEPRKKVKIKHKIQKGQERNATLQTELAIVNARAEKYPTEVETKEDSTVGQKISELLKRTSRDTSLEVIELEAVKEEKAPEVQTPPKQTKEKPEDMERDAK